MMSTSSEAESVRRYSSVMSAALLMFSLTPQGALNPERPGTRNPVSDERFQPENDDADEQEIPPDALIAFLFLVSRGRVRTGRNRAAGASERAGGDFLRIHGRQIGL